MRRSAGFLFLGRKEPAISYRMPSDFQLARVGFLFRCVAGTGQDREPWILGETRVGEGEFTQEEARPASGLNPASVKAIGAQTSRSALFRRILLLTHECRISQHAVLTHAVES
jgi:hypothetical protein